VRMAVGITHPRHQGRLAGQGERIVALYRTGATLQEIGDRYGVSREAIRLVLARYGVTRRDGGAHRRISERQVNALVRRLVNAKPCRVCGYWILRTFNGKERTCSPECSRDWRVLRYILDPAFREAHSLAVADWMIRHPEGYPPAQVLHAMKVLLGEAGGVGAMWGRRYVLPGSRVHQLALRYRIPHEVAGRAA
jgi:hypothetical protein